MPTRPRQCTVYLVHFSAVHTLTLYIIEFHFNIIPYFIFVFVLHNSHLNLPDYLSTFSLRTLAHNVADQFSMGHGRAERAQWCARLDSVLGPRWSGATIVVDSNGFLNVGAKFVPCSPGVTVPLPTQSRDPADLALWSSTDKCWYLPSALTGRRLFVKLSSALGTAYWRVQLSTVRTCEVRTLTHSSVKI